MHHRSVQRRLSSYLDGDLAPRQRRRIESHLAACPDCGRVYRTLSLVVARMRLLRGPADQEIAERAIVRLRRDAPP